MEKIRLVNGSRLKPGLIIEINKEITITIPEGLNFKRDVIYQVNEDGSIEELNFLKHIKGVTTKRYPPMIYRKHYEDAITEYLKDPDYSLITLVKDLMWITSQTAI